MSWRLVFTKQAQKDAKRIAQSGLKIQASRYWTFFEKTLTRIHRHSKSSWGIFPVLFPDE